MITLHYWFRMPPGGGGRRKPFRGEAQKLDRDKICNRVAEVLKVLGHPVRLQIVQTLLTRESCVKNLWSCLELSQATVSQHLSVLKGKGIVDSSREGVSMRYWVCDDISKLLIGTLMNHFGMDCCEAALQAEAEGDTEEDQDAVI